MKAERIIEKFGLRNRHEVGGKLGQKMDEECIQQFIRGDPSGNGKYLEWMFFQAGGGKTSMDRSVTQWGEGQYGDRSLRDQLRDRWIEDRVKGFVDDDGKRVEPVALSQAQAEWEEQDEKALREDFIYGDEDLTAFGCFGFYRQWPGKGGIYDTIVKMVHRFHRHRLALAAKGKSTDLSLTSYPNLSDLASVLKYVTVAELKADIDYDLVFSNDYLIVFCPLNIGASLKTGIARWCTSSETMFMKSLEGGPNRWKEYGEDSALYYFRFRQLPKGNGIHTRAVAVQVPFGPITKDTAEDQARVAAATYWDADDKSTDLKGWLEKMTGCEFTTKDYLDAFGGGLLAVVKHFRAYPKARLIVNYAGS